MEFGYKRKRIISKLWKKFVLCILFFYSIFLIKNNTTFGFLSSIKNKQLNGQTEDDLNLTYIFIGGYARSGTTLMRAILDVHEELNCGPETKIIPKFLEFYRSFLDTKSNSDALEEAKIETITTDSAARLFINHILKNRTIDSKYLCTKDPDILYYMNFLHKIYPNSKFIYMIRDPRAVVYSLMRIYNETRSVFKIKSYLGTWKWFNVYVKNQCDDIGPEFCKIVKYENLVTNPKEEIKRVVDFLDISWTDEFLKHEKYVGTKIVVSDTEWSTDQIKRPIYQNSVDEWRSHFPELNLLDENDKAVLKRFGYTDFS